MDATGDMTQTHPKEGAEERPLVTFALFAYNQEKYIREAVEGAFSQTYEPLEIILSDDCSTDRTFEIMQQMAATYSGPHRVRVRQNEHNLGLGSHVNVALSGAMGEIFVLGAGDDISEAERSQLSADLLMRYPAAAEIIVSADIIDKDGNVVHYGPRRKDAERLQTLEDLLSWKHRTLGAGRAVRRRVFEAFGPLRNNCPTEDTTFLLRSLLHGGCILSSETALRYRVHDYNISSANSMRKIDVDAIHAQYAADIDHAVKLGLLNQPQLRSLYRWIKDDAVVRFLTKKLNSNERFSAKDLVIIFSAPKLTLKDRLKAFMLMFFGIRTAA